MESIFKFLKGCLYAFFVGCIFYAGGYGFAVIFTRKEEKRENIANWNIALCLLEILIIVVYFFYWVLNDVYDHPFLFNLIDLLIYHFIFSLVGSLIYLIWWVGTLFSRH
jgi:hypothetical protein